MVTPTSSRSLSSFILAHDFSTTGSLPVGIMTCVQDALARVHSHDTPRVQYRVETVRRPRIEDQQTDKHAFEFIMRATLAR